MQTLVSKKDGRKLLLYEGVFDDETVDDLMGLLLCKRKLEWKVVRGIKEEALLFSYRKPYTLDLEPYPVNKHQDILNVMLAKIRNIFEELEEKELFIPPRYQGKNTIVNPDYCLCRCSYHQNIIPDQDTFVYDEKNTKRDTPIIFISLGSMDIKINKKSYKLKNGSVLLLFNYEECIITWDQKEKIKIGIIMKYMGYD